MIHEVCKIEILYCEYVAAYVYRKTTKSHVFFYCHHFYDLCAKRGKTHVYYDLENRWIHQAHQDMNAETRHSEGEPGIDLEFAVFPIYIMASYHSQRRMIYAARHNHVSLYFLLFCENLFFFGEMNDYEYVMNYIC